MKKKYVSFLLLLTTAMIWGFTFVAQRVGGESLGTFAFNGIRFGLGAISLIPVVLIFDRTKMSRERLKKTLCYGVLCGVVLYLAAALQQYGIELTHSAGKAGFITGLYIVLVPILAFLIYRQKQGINVWIGAVLAVAGMFLMSVTKDFRIETGDIVLVLGSIFWALHIILIDRCVSIVRPLKLAITQFAVCSALNLITTAFTGGIQMENVKVAWIALLFGGVGSVGIAYTFQVLAQKDSDPTVAAIVLSTESIFGAIGGALLLHERMGVQEIIGAVLIFSGVVISQIRFSRKKNPEKINDKENVPNIDNVG